MIAAMDPWLGTGDDKNAARRVVENAVLDDQ